MTMPQVTVVVSTYNRAHLLPTALRALAQQVAPVPYEVVVVDNNSTDSTRQAVESCREWFDGCLRYEFEPRQGLSYARNAGIRTARSPLIAFTDDDVQVTPRWVARMHQVSCEYPDIDCFGGKVLPRWRSAPPSWLDRRHWSPLALTDHGDEPFMVSAERPQCLIGANLVIRRRAFERAGLFAPDFHRAQDHEWLLRFWRAGLRGLYEPGLVVCADIDPERMTRRYHRRWHLQHGRYSARMRLRELIDPNGALYEGSPPPYSRLFGSARFLFADLFREMHTTVRLTVTGAERSETLSHLDAVYDLLGCLREGGARWWAGRRRPVPESAVPRAAPDETNERLEPDRGASLQPAGAPARARD